MVLILYMAAGIIVLVFFIFLFSGELNYELESATNRLFTSASKERDTAPAPPVVTPVQEPVYDEAFQRQLSYMETLVKLDLCVLNAQEQMAKVALSAASNRENY